MRVNFSSFVVEIETYLAVACGSSYAHNLSLNTLFRNFQKTKGHYAYETKSRIAHVQGNFS